MPEEPGVLTQRPQSWADGLGNGVTWDPAASGDAGTETHDSGTTQKMSGLPAIARGCMELTERARRAVERACSSSESDEEEVSREVDEEAVDSAGGTADSAGVAASISIGARAVV